MASTNHTTNYSLPQWLSNDYVLMDDFNSAFATIDSNLKSISDKANLAKSEADTNASAISSLQTSVSTNTSDIATNTGNISTNASAITALQSGKQKVITQSASAPSSPSANDMWLDTSNANYKVLKVYLSSVWVEVGRIRSDQITLQNASSNFASTTVEGALNELFVNKLKQDASGNAYIGPHGVPILYFDAGRGALSKIVWNANSTTPGNMEFTVEGTKVMLLASSGSLQLWDGVSTYKTVLTTGNAGAQYISVADSGNLFPNATTPKTSETVLANVGSRLAALESTKTNFKVYLTADQTPALNSDVKIPFNVTDFDDLNEFDKTNFKWTATKAGTYEFTLYTYINNTYTGGTNFLSCTIKKNGIPIQVVGATPTGTNDGVRMLGGTTRTKIAVGDVIEAYVNVQYAATIRGVYTHWTSFEGYQVK
jgi:hypothetical protein